MKRRTFFIVLLLLIVVATVSLCGRRCNHEVPILNVDSLFFDLNKEMLAQRAKQADKVFTGLSRNGLNGVVLYAE